MQLMSVVTAAVQSKAVKVSFLKAIVAMIQERIAELEAEAVLPAAKGQQVLPMSDNNAPANNNNNNVAPMPVNNNNIAVEEFGAETNAPEKDSTEVPTANGMEFA